MPQTLVNDARLHYRLEGDPALPAIVLVHPIGADHGLWDRVVPLLTEWACVLRYDLRGHGGSEATPGEYTLELLASDLLALATHVGFERFMAAGVSLGALTVLQAAAHAPNRVRAIALCSAAARIPPPPGGWEGRAQLVRERGMAPLGPPMVERMFSAGFREAGHAAIETLRTTLLRMDPGGYASACAVLRDADLSAELPRIAQAAVVISGAQDPLTPPAAGVVMAQALAAGRHEVLQGGHFPPLESPVEFARELRRLGG
jgi:3-oxoadipate enol-lactonase